MPKSFEDIGNMQLEDIKPPPLIPRGSYLVGVTSTPEAIKSSQKQTDGWRFHLKFFQARDDVDRGELAACIEEGGYNGITDIEWDDDFYVTDRSAFMLGNFLKDVMGFSNMGLKQAVAECSGKQYIATIGHQPTKRPDGTMGLRAQIVGRARA